MFHFKLHRTHLIRGAVIIHDIIAAGLSLCLGLTLRYGQLPGTEFAIPVACFMAIAGVAGYLCRLNSGVWRYASLSDIEAIVKTASLTVVTFALFLFMVNRLDTIPRTSIIASWGAMVLLLSGSRVIYRLMRNRRSQHRADHRRNVLLVGASANAENFIKAVNERADLPYRVLGLVDDRDRRTGLSIRGCRVLGSAHDLDDVIAGLSLRGLLVDALILTSTSSRHGNQIFNAVAMTAKRRNLQLLRLPELNDLQGDGVASAMVPQPLVLEDLLPRRPVTLDREAVGNMIRGTTVLVTGAGGSIGSELCRQLLGLMPKRLILVDSSEYLLYSINSEMVAGCGQAQIISRLSNVRNRNRIRALFEELRPDLVFHAAALKHVPIVEAQPLEGLNTNVLGTRNVADAAIAAGVKAMVLISTDKAVNPTSVMGASKRIAEAYCQSLDTADGTRFVTVRFGNVLGSAGSVVPLFEKQIRNGGPVTVTHPEIERYSMTIPEAAQLVLHATTNGIGDHDSLQRIFVLDMGRPVKIVDVARQMIRLAGLEPDRDIEIKFIGLRPGEKLHEELFRESEGLVATNVDGVLSASPQLMFDHQSISALLNTLASAVEAGDVGIGLHLAKKLVPEYIVDKRLAWHFAAKAAPLRLVAGQEQS